MSKIKLRPLLASGLIAGVVMNVGEAGLHGGILGTDAEELYKTLNAPPPNPAQTIPLLVGMTFLMGIIAMWLYGALYSRFENRVRSALSAGVVVWLLAHLWSGVYLGAGYSGIVTPRLAWIPVAWGFFEAIVAVFAGSLVYRDR